MKLNIPTEPQTESKGPAMKTRVIVHRSLLRGTFYILAALSLIAYLLPARAEAGVRVVAQVGPVAVDYRDRGPGYDARAAVYLEPVAARVLVGRPACGPDRPGCLVRVVDRCDRHDRNRDGRCDKCERRDRRDDRRDSRRDDRCDSRCDDHRDDRHACDSRGGRDGIGSRGERCEHSDRCNACGTIEVGGCRDHRGLTWVAGHYEREMGRHGRGNRVWVDAHWERLEVAHR